MKKLNLILSSIFILNFFPPSLSHGADQHHITGKAKVIDGDSIKINGKNIRLFGIDAFELKQSCENNMFIWGHCGKESKRFLEDLIDGQRITCSYREKDRYGRILGICYHGVYYHNDPLLEINGTMVFAGRAIAYTKYSKRYLELENSAKKDKAGIWRYGFKETPEQWRRKKK